MIADPLTVRANLAAQTRRSIVGPDRPEEVIHDPPSRTYLCGFLSPQGHAADDEQNDELPSGDSESSLEGIPSLVNAMWPSAMGLTVHVKPEAETIQVRVSLAFYVAEPAAIAEAAPPAVGGLLADPAPAAAEVPKKKERRQWRRRPFEETHLVRVGDASQVKVELFADDATPAKLELDIRRHNYGEGRPRLLTLTLLNRSSFPDDAEWEDLEAAKVFQPLLELSAEPGQEAEIFVEAPAGADRVSDPDFRQHLLLYRHARDFATGHGCAASWTRTTPRHRTATAIRTEFMPEATVRGLIYDPFTGEDAESLTAAVLAALPADERGDDPNVIFEMAALAGAKSDAWILAALEGLCRAYETWLADRRGTIEDAVAQIRETSLAAAVRETAEDNLNVLGRDVLLRMRAGIVTLSRDPVAFRCFRLANEAMHRQQTMKVLQDRAKGEPGNSRPIAWRPFQLAFLLQSINSIAAPDTRIVDDANERDLMDLIWFPTGGGKTEAYLGLTAFTLFHRRLRQTDPDHGGGVSVITRYTMRLLTTQQFDRAARLLCAMEVLRTDGRDQRGNALRLGREEFRIGLWIGGDSSPNYFRDFDESEGAISILQRIRNGEEIRGSDVRHLRACPWCGTAIRPGDMSVLDSSGREATKWKKDETYRFVYRCGGTLPAPQTGPCPFRRAVGLPVQIIDEEIYASPPSLLIGTVDKFARLAWKRESLAFFGRGGASRPVPDLIIQDELHLISGPLGTMVGHYETAIEELARDADGRRPKVIGSTATIRRAEDQVKGLFNRPVRQFPPPALTAGDSFFAREDRDSPGRLYLGVMAPGISGKTLLLRACGTLLQLAAEIPRRSRATPTGLWWPTSTVSANSPGPTSSARTTCRVTCASSRNSASAGVRPYPCASWACPRSSPAAAKRETSRRS